MKGETSAPYFCGLPDHQLGGRSAFDMAVKFCFQNH